MERSQEFPENRPKDEHGAPLPGAGQAKEEGIRDGRINREQQEIANGFASQPVAGHHRGRERSRREDG